MSWVDQIFGADIESKEGGGLRRSKKSVHKLASFGQLLEQVKERGYHLISTRDQYVIVCNSDAVKLHC